MDPWTVLVGLSVCCLSALLIYIITLVSMREKTYDEVIAEQKKRQEEEREKVKNDKKIEKEQMKKKYKKGKGDKTKEKAAQESDNSSTSEHSSKKNGQKKSKMVNLEIEPEIIESADVGLGSQKSKHSVVRKRSILHNKDEVTPVVEKAAELHHKPIKPLDDLELKKLHDMKTHEVSAVKKGKGQHTDQKQVDKEEQKTQHTDLKQVKEIKVQKTQQTVQKAEVKETKIQKTKTTEQRAAAEGKGVKSKSATVINGSSLKGSHLIDTLRTVELSDFEIQSLIDVLLNRQGASVDAQVSWNKKSQKGDPVTMMKKQLEEKEKALLEEQQRLASSASQVKELRASLTAEKQKVSVVEKQYEAQVKQQKADNEALQARLSNIHATHLAETANVKLQVEQLEKEKSAEATACAKLKQENKILQESLSKAVMDSSSKGDVTSLKQKVSIIEKQLSDNTVQLNAAERAQKSSEEKIKKYEEQIKSLESSKKSDEGAKKQVSELQEEVKKATSQNSQLSSDLKKATSALSTVEAECSMWKAKLQELEKHLSSLGDVGTKLQDSERKKEKLEGSMKTVEKQLAEAVTAQKETGAKLQESEDKRQELEGNLKNVEKQLSDAVHSQKDMSTELQQLRQANSSLSQELKMAQEKQTQASSATASNGDVHAEKDAQNVIQASEHERIVSEKVAQLTKIQTALDAQTKRNNEEVKRAVSETEKNDREVLKRLFPALSLSDKMEHKDWLATFEKQAAQVLQQSSEKKACEKISHLEDENSRLQADVEVFKNNIAILHTEKDRIRELEEENRKLQHQSETYEKNFMQLNADQERLQHLEEENQRLKNTSADPSLSEKVSTLQEENEELQSRLQEKEENIAEVEKKLQNLQRVVETEEKKWKEKLRQAEEALAKGSDSSSREQELEDLTIQQQTQIEHYRTVLTNTERLLRQLESAEKSWEERLQASQDDLQKARSECQKAQEELHALRGSTEDLSDLGFAYRCVEKSLTSIVDEMQGKMEDLQEELRLSNEQVNILTKQGEELASKVIVLESQNKAIAQVDNEDLRKESERKRNKELSSTLVRLNGIIKTGQDALSQEQKLVQQLQEQMATRTKGSGANANQEIEQLRSKLSEKEKQLEREIAANKQLSQRLGQLGVLGNSNGNSDQGTSV
ncbi:uncharacterized protein LOC143281463 [Babylonia areolata]|uniref:uncharacterized protein LOC143281463 n=1 Tax=Babylonia areolata TaxID=304850 RepID=UPI003FD434CB